MIFYQERVFFESDVEFFQFHRRLLSDVRQVLYKGNMGLLSHNFNPSIPADQKANCYQIDRVIISITAHLDETTDRLTLIEAIDPARIACTKIDSDNLGIITTPETEVILELIIQDNSRIESITLIMLLEALEQIVSKHQPGPD